MFIIAKIALIFISYTAVHIYNFHQEPITRSFHLQYLPSESTMFRIFLIIEAPSTEFFVGVYIITNYKRAVVLYCLRHMQRRNRGRPFAFDCQFFFGCYANVCMFLQEIKEPHTYLSSKNKKVWDRVDSRVQLVWRIRVMAPVFLYSQS